MVWSQRSVDVMIGLASDMVSAWALLRIICAATGFKPGEVHMQLGDCHIYAEHLNMAQAQIQRDTTNCPRPQATLDFRTLQDFDFNVTNYSPLDIIRYELKVSHERRI